MVFLWNIDRWVKMLVGIEMLFIYKYVFCIIYRRKFIIYIYDVFVLLSYNRYILWFKMYVV